MSEHQHECIYDTPDHGICRCECGATAFNNMGETEWDEAKPSTPASDHQDSGASE